MNIWWGRKSHKVERITVHGDFPNGVKSLNFTSDGKPLDSVASRIEFSKVEQARVLLETLHMRQRIERGDTVWLGAADKELTEALEILKCIM